MVQQGLLAPQGLDIAEFQTHLRFYNYICYLQE